MDAIILAAGMGRRLKSVTKDKTKCMITVNGVTLIERMLNQLDGLNLNKIIIVVGYQSEKLIDFISTLNIKTTIEFVFNDIYDKTNNIFSLFLVKHYLENSDCLILEADLIFDDGILESLVNDKQPNLALVDKFESWMDGTVVTIDDDNNILNFYSKNQFSFEDIKSYYKTVNIYKFSKHFSNNFYVPFLEAYVKSLGYNAYYEQVLKIISNLNESDMKIKKIGDEKWYEIDNVQDLDIAESIFADQNSKYFDINQNEICVCNSISEIMKFIFEFCLKNDSKIGLLAPNSIESYSNFDSKNIIVFEDNPLNVKYDSNTLIDFFNDKCIDMLILSNPNDFGNYIIKKDLLNLIKWAESNDILLLIDESYVDLIDIEHNPTILSQNLIDEFSNLIVVKNLSALYGISGVELSVFASKNTNLVDYVKRNLPLHNINSFSEFYLQIFEKYGFEFDIAINKFKNSRKNFIEGLKKVKNLRVIPSQSGFIICEVLGKITSAELVKILLNDYNFLIEDLSTSDAFNCKSYIKIAVKDGDTNNELIDALIEILN